MNDPSVLGDADSLCGFDDNESSILRRDVSRLFAKPTPAEFNGSAASSNNRNEKRIVTMALRFPNSKREGLMTLDFQASCCQLLYVVV